MGTVESIDSCCCVNHQCPVQNIPVITERCSPFNETGHLEETGAGGVVFREGEQTQDPSLFLDGLQESVQRLVPGTVAVIVSDLSGFTSTTRKWGIVHMASLIIRQRQLCLPMLHRRGALHIGFEADNLIVAFPVVAEAVLAAVELRDILARHNSNLTDDSVSHYRIKLNGVGVHCGSGVLVDRRGNLYGEAARGAYHLGEDVCEGGSVLITKAVKETIESHRAFAAANFSAVNDEECGQCFAVSPDFLPALSLEDTKVPSHEDDRYIHKATVPLALRAAPPSPGEVPGEDCAEVDEWKLQERTVLMFRLEVDASKVPMPKEVAHKILPLLEEQLSIRSEIKALRVLAPALEAGGGLAVEEALWIFSNPIDALLATVEARRNLRNFLSSSASGQTAGFDVGGYGIHTGPMLFIEGTDVHWGDPVNTASKLGQDLATNGDILLSDSVFEAVQADNRCTALKFEERHLRRSKVDFHCFAVHEALVQRH
mmetsp:Transcript_33074/g.77366  ORF Transcript_33074/g.77366 Transcript_33074/m.77366 type:complete len:486 (+) Transcript_33074:105-1562(+)